MDWRTNSMPLAKEMESNKSKSFIRIPNGTDSFELNQYSHKDILTYFDGLSFPDQIE